MTATPIQCDAIKAALQSGARVLAAIEGDAAVDTSKSPNFQLIVVLAVSFAQLSAAKAAAQLTANQRAEVARLTPEQINAMVLHFWHEVFQ